MTLPGTRSARAEHSAGCRERLGRALARVVLVPWHTLARGEFWSQPFPDDAPRPQGRGHRADRILLLGSGLAHGPGVRSHELSLAGHLARATARLRGGVADLHLLTGAHTAEVRRLARAAASHSYDAVVLLGGAEDALTLAPEASWHASLSDIRRVLHRIGPGGPELIVAGVPPLELLHRGWIPLRRLVGRHARRLDAVSRDLVAEWERAAFVPLPGVPVGTAPSAAYRLLAEPLSLALATRLAARSPAGDRPGDAPGATGALPERT